MTLVSRNLAKFVALSVAGLPIMFTSQAPANDVIVIGDTGVRIPPYILSSPGQKLSGDPMIHLDCRDKLILWTDGKIVELEGPYDGLLSAYKKQPACSERERIISGPPERKELYLRYFFSICQKQVQCDDVCKAVLQQIEPTKLKCP
jgi:hypothetical protein